MKQAKPPNNGAVLYIHGPNHAPYKYLVPINFMVNAGNTPDCHFPIIGAIQVGQHCSFYLGARGLDIAPRSQEVLVNQASLKVVGRLNKGDLVSVGKTHIEILEIILPTGVPVAPWESHGASPRGTSGQIPCHRCGQSFTGTRTQQNWFQRRGSSELLVCSSCKDGDLIKELKLDREVLEILGRSGYGVTLKTREKGGTLGVLKLIKTQHLGSKTKEIKEAIQQFKNSTFTHPCVMATTQISIEGPHLTMSWPYIEGQDLEKLSKKQPPSESAFLAIVTKILETLGAAHEQKICHGDLNARKVLVLADPGKIKILGFGRDIFWKEQSHSMGAANIGLIQPKSLNTPEDHDSRLDTDSPRAPMLRDFYQLGLLCYEAFTGASPHQSKSSVGLIDQLTTVPAPALREHAPKLSQGFSDFVAKLLEIHPEDRYQSASQALKALSRS